MASKHEQVLDAVKALIATALPNARVDRNRPERKRISPGGDVVVWDGDAGEPEVTLSPLTYTYSRRIPVEIAPYESASLTREQVLDQMRQAIGAAVQANRTLGGLADWLEPVAADTDDLPVFGAADTLWSAAEIVATYSTTSPL